MAAAVVSRAASKRSAPSAHCRQSMWLARAASKATGTARAAVARKDLLASGLTNVTNIGGWLVRPLYVLSHTNCSRLFLDSPLRKITRLLPHRQIPASNAARIEAHCNCPVPTTKKKEKKEKKEKKGKKVEWPRGRHQEHGKRKDTNPLDYQAPGLELNED